MQLRQELDQAQLRLQQETLGIAAQVQSVAKADFDRARSEMEHLEVQVNSQKSEVQRVNRDAVDYTGLQAEIDAKRKILSDLMARQTQTSSSERLKETTASNVRIVDKAELPIAPVSPRKILSLLSALASGLLLGVAMAFGIDHLDDTLKDEADIGRAGATVVLGYIPLFQPLRSVEGGTEDGKGDETNRIDLAAHIDSRSAFSEAFKNLRTSILLASPTGAPVRIAVTSCEPQDGKSTVSINLAIVLTQLGRRVLLVDADLRRPRVHRSFEVDNVVGFSSVLTANAELDECIQETAIPNLRVLSSGPIPPNPSELLGSQRMTEVLDSLRDKFDHIILDSPPVLSVTDPVLLSTRVDATIMVVRMGKTRRDGLALAAARLSQAHVRTPCTVLNGVDERSKHYYYYGGYRNYRADDASPGPSRKRDTRRTSAGA
jgi:capsular exopolysaccharide synthesis family protein